MMGNKSKFSIEDAIKVGTEIGIQVALEKLKEEKEARRKTRYDRRLRNTKLLLREYRVLSLHCKEAIYKISQLSGENAVEILEELDYFEYDDEHYINSIKQSAERTATIISHIDKMLELYEVLCIRSVHSEDQRRFRVIKAMYLNEEPEKAEDIAARECINLRTIYKDIDNAVTTLTALIFGIDGFKIS